MSSNLNITFASDMPAASVEVVAPDMQVVEHIMLAAGRTKDLRKNRIVIWFVPGG